MKHVGAPLDQTLLSLSKMAQTLLKKDNTRWKCLYSNK